MTKGLIVNCIPSRIYILEGPNGTLKLGRSKDPYSRAKQVSGFCGGQVLVRWASSIVEHATMVEKLAHQFLHGRLAGPEWHAVDLHEVLAAIWRAFSEADRLLAAMAADAGKSQVRLSTVYYRNRWPDSYGRRK